MTWRVVWQPQALNDLRRLDRQTAVRVRTAVRQFASAGVGDVKRLRDRGGELRLRMESWRVRFLLQHADGTVCVLRILPRDRAYRG